MTMAPLIEKNPCKTRQFTNFILKMADLPEIQVFNNILEAVHYHKDAFRFELATYKGTPNLIILFIVHYSN